MVFMVAAVTVVGTQIFGSKLFVEFSVVDKVWNPYRFERCVLLSDIVIAFLKYCLLAPHRSHEPSEMRDISTAADLLR